MACSVACSGSPSRGQIYTAKALHLHLGLLSICSNYSVVLTVIGGCQGVTHLSSKDLPSMAKVTTYEVQSTTGDKKEDHSIPSNIPCVKVGTIQKVMSKTYDGVNLVGKVTEWSKVITE